MGVSILTEKFGHLFIDYVRYVLQPAPACIFVKKIRNLNYEQIFRFRLGCHFEDPFPSLSKDNHGIRSYVKDSHALFFSAILDTPVLAQIERKKRQHESSMSQAIRNISRKATSEEIARLLSPRLQERLEHDHSYGGHFTSPESVATPISTLRNVIDPTEHQTYFPWLLRTYLSGGIALWEDMFRAEVALEKYHAIKRTLPIEQRDINKFKSLPDLEDVALPMEPAVSGKELRRRASEEIRKQTTIFYEGPDGMVVSPDTVDAAVYWGKGTRWCTSATESENYFDTYDEDGPLVIVLRGDRKYQLHFHSGQYANARDDLIAGEQEFSDVRWGIAKGDLHEPMKYYDVASYIALGFPFTAREFLEAVDQDPNIIGDIHNPTKAMMKRAVQRQRDTIDLIQNPPEDIKKMAVEGTHGLSLAATPEDDGKVEVHQYKILHDRIVSEFRRHELTPQTA